MSVRKNGKFDQRRFGDLVLSVQASEFHYCSPRKDFDTLGSYTEVEVAMFPANGSTPRWLRPSLLAGYEGPSDAEVGYTSYDDVAAFVPVEVVTRLEKALAEWAARGGFFKTPSPEKD